MVNWADISEPQVMPNEQKDQLIELKEKQNMCQIFHSYW